MLIGISSGHIRVQRPKKPYARNEVSLNVLYSVEQVSRFHVVANRALKIWVLNSTAGG